MPSRVHNREEGVVERTEREQFLTENSLGVVLTIPVMYLMMVSFEVQSSKRMV